MAMEKTFDALEAETRLYQAWEEAGCFKAGVGARRADTFCIMIPPPNVTGSLHMGHAFNNTLQDILVRWHRMRGFDTLWQPGQDHAGIATQMVVERELNAKGQKRTDYSRADFVDLVWEQKKTSGGTIIEQLKRLGASCDWSRNAFTMAGAPGDSREGHENSPDFHSAVMKAFVDMYNDGIIYRGKRLVNWDPKFETAISDLEVENIETPGHMWHFKYPLADGKTYTYVEKDEDGAITLEEERDYISIATTRPETMLGDGAVAVHPDDTRYAPIVGALCEIPVGPKARRRLIPIITDAYPDPSFGSGAVKITGAHDFNDYGVAKRNGIPLYRLMDTVAAMRSDGLSYDESAAKATEWRNGAEMSEAEVDQVNLVPESYRGLDRMEARKKVVEEITAEGLAVMETLAKTDTDTGQETVETRPLVENKPIMQPFGDRSKVVIEPMLTDQWFVDAARIVGPAIAAVRTGDTKILPERDEKVYFHWLENIEPWCISRQLWWGHQVPVWYDEDDNQYCAMTEAEAVALADGKSLRRDPDVLDTWFSSGLWPLGTLGWPYETEELEKYFPTTTLVTGFDIIFFWVARMMMMQYAMVDQKPFGTVYVHALVRDEKGQKMSKSLGNVIDPLVLIDGYGADAVRFTLTAMAAMGRDLKLSEQRVAGYRNFGTKLWNACRFAELNECYDFLDFSTKNLPPRPKFNVNRWILGETAKVRESVDDALNAYRFNDAANALYAFVWGQVCDWYVELSKPLLQGEDPLAKAEARQCMAWVLDQCLVLLHPIMPFITEELWENLVNRNGQKLMLQAWPDYAAAEMVDAEADAEMNWVISFIEAIRSARAQMNVPASAKIPVVCLNLGEGTKATIADNDSLIKKLARIESFAHKKDAPKGAIAVHAGQASFALPLADIIDVSKEKARLEKNLGKLDKEIGGLKGRVNNPKFVASAPLEVVEEAKANLEIRSGEAQVVRDALDRLNEL